MMRQHGAVLQLDSMCTRPACDICGCLWCRVLTATMHKQAAAAAAHVVGGGAGLETQQAVVVGQRVARHRRTAPAVHRMCLCSSARSAYEVGTYTGPAEARAEQRQAIGLVDTTAAVTSDSCDIRHWTLDHIQLPLLGGVWDPTKDHHSQAGPTRCERPQCPWPLSRSLGTVK